MRSRVLSTARIVLWASCLTVGFCITTFSQRNENETWGCGATDYKCQLDGRMKAMQANPKDPENYYNIGLVFQRGGSCKDAIDAYDMYLNIPGVKPELQADGYNNRGICQRRSGKSDAAFADHSKAIELNPKRPEYFLNRGNDLSDLGKLDDAIADYSKAILLDPKYALAYTNRGHLYAEGNNFDAAITDLTKAIELDPTNPESFYLRAMAHRGKSEFDQAIPDLDRYIASNPNPSDPRYLSDGYLNRAIAYASLNKLNLALTDASKAIELAPKYYDAYAVRAIIYRRLNKEDLAKADEVMAAKLKTGN